MNLKVEMKEVTASLIEEIRFAFLSQDCQIQSIRKIFRYKYSTYYMVYIGYKKIFSCYSHSSSKLTLNAIKSHFI